MIVRQEFKGKDYHIGMWILGLVKAADQTIAFSEIYRVDGPPSITVTYDSTEFKRLIRRVNKLIEQKKI